MRQALVILLMFGLIHQMLTATVPSKTPESTNSNTSSLTAVSISNEESDMSSEEEAVLSVRSKRGNCNKGADKLTLGSQNATVLISTTPPSIDIRGNPQPIG